MPLELLISLIILFGAGGLTPGPAVMLVVTSALRFGFAKAMIAALGICIANAFWITLAATGVGALATKFPTLFLALKLLGLGFVVWLAWSIATQPIKTTGLTDNDADHQGGKTSTLLFKGIGLQLANPNALVFFGGLLPSYFVLDAPILPQVITMILAVTATELFGLTVYAAGARALSRWFANPRFARIFYISAAIIMVASIIWALLTQTSHG